MANLRGLPGIDVMPGADAPVVRFVDDLLRDAVGRGASDVHIEPCEGRTRVRLRIDGVLHTAPGPPRDLNERIVARVKIMSQLDIVERRRPQDGRMKIALPGHHGIDFRVSTLPTLHGEKVVIRILGREDGLPDAAGLGLSAAQHELYLAAIARPFGLVLVTGPTGSGKTTTLYAALNRLNEASRNICSVEDPVEINLDGVNQVNINERAGLGFATALRAFLRQDPDIIMVGEIRDPETVDIALKASQTGHLVLSTLHTNDAPAALTRLLNMGARPFDLASSLSLVMAQRLVRKLCAHCRRPQTLSAQAARAAGLALDGGGGGEAGLQIFSAGNCARCVDGYRGCTGVFQCMAFDAAMAELVLHRPGKPEVEKLARAGGMQSLRRAALDKVRAGVTSLAEAARVTGA